jgi:excisionase family DNA binding protein
MSEHLTSAIEALITEEVQRRVAETAASTIPPLTVDEFAAKSRLAKPTVYSLIRRNRLRTVDTGTRRVLIPASELARWLTAKGAA